MNDGIPFDGLKPRGPILTNNKNKKNQLEQKSKIPDFIVDQSLRDEIFNELLKVHENPDDSNDWTVIVNKIENEVFQDHKNNSNDYKLKVRNIILPKLIGHKNENLRKSLMLNEITITELLTKKNLENAPNENSQVFEMPIPFKDPNSGLRNIVNKNENQKKIKQDLVQKLNNIIEEKSLLEDKNQEYSDIIQDLKQHNDNLTKQLKSAGQLIQESQVTIHSLSDESRFLELRELKIKYESVVKELELVNRENQILREKNEKENKKIQEIIEENKKFRLSIKNIASLHTELQNNLVEFTSIPENNEVQSEDLIQKNSDSDKINDVKSNFINSEEEKEINHVDKIHSITEKIDEKEENINEKKNFFEFSENNQSENPFEDFRVTSSLKKQFTQDLGFDNLKTNVNLKSENQNQITAQNTNVNEQNISCTSLDVNQNKKDKENAKNDIPLSNKNKFFDDDEEEPDTKVVEIKEEGTVWNAVYLEKKNSENHQNNENKFYFKEKDEIENVQISNTKNDDIIESDINQNTENAIQFNNENTETNFHNVEHNELLENEIQNKSELITKNQFEPEEKIQIFGKETEKNLNENYFNDSDNKNNQNIKTQNNLFFDNNEVDESEVKTENNDLDHGKIQKGEIAQKTKSKNNFFDDDEEDEEINLEKIIESKKAPINSKLDKNNFFKDTHDNQEELDDKKIVQSNPKILENRAMDVVFEEIKPKVVEEVKNIIIAQPKIVKNNFFDDDDEEDNGNENIFNPPAQSSKVTQVIPKVENKEIKAVQETPKLITNETIPTKTTNKFFDDEDLDNDEFNIYTKPKVINKKEPSPKKAAPIVKQKNEEIKNVNNTGLSNNLKQKNNFFDDEDQNDENLNYFSSKAKVPSNNIVEKIETKPTNQKKNNFFDDEDDNGFGDFGSLVKTQVKEIPKNNKIISTKKAPEVVNKQQVAKNIFQETLNDEDDLDNLFNQLANKNEKKVENKKLFY